MSISLLAQLLCNNVTVDELILSKYKLSRNQIETNPTSSFPDESRHNIHSLPRHKECMEKYHNLKNNLDEDRMKNVFHKRCLRSYRKKHKAAMRLMKNKQKTHGYYPKNLKDMFVPRRSKRCTRATKQVVPDDDIWIGIPVIASKTTKKTRSMYFSLKHRIAFLDEPPSGASIIIPTIPLNGSSSLKMGNMKSSLRREKRTKHGSEPTRKRNRKKKDEWIEFIVVNNRKKQTMRLMYYSVRTRIGVWDEPPSKVRNIISPRSHHAMEGSEPLISRNDQRSLLLNDFNDTSDLSMLSKNNETKTKSKVENNQILRSTPKVRNIVSPKSFHTIKDPEPLISRNDKRTLFLTDFKDTTELSLLSVSSEAEMKSKAENHQIIRKDDNLSREENNHIPRKEDDISREDKNPRREDNYIFNKQTNEIPKDEHSKHLAEKNNVSRENDNISTDSNNENSKEKSNQSSEEESNPIGEEDRQISREEKHKISKEDVNQITTEGHNQMSREKEDHFLKDDDSDESSQSTLFFDAHSESRDVDEDIEASISAFRDARETMTELNDLFSCVNQIKMESSSFEESEIDDADSVSVSNNACETMTDLNDLFVDVNQVKTELSSFEKSEIDDASTVSSLSTLPVNDVDEKDESFFLVSKDVEDVISSFHESSSYLSSRNLEMSEELSLEFEKRMKMNTWVVFNDSWNNVTEETSG